MDTKNVTLRELGTKYDADKKIHTGLLEQYEEYLPKECKKFLEIGCLYGNSARMFKEWYGDGTEFHLLDLFGEGFLDENEIKKEGFKTYKGSQSNIGLLQTLPKDIDVISEDGSHHSDEQIITFKHLFLNNLASGGLYIIEDCYGHFDSFWRRGIIHNPNDTIIPIMKRVIEGGDFTSQFITQSESDLLKDVIAEIKICDDITIFIWKK